MTLIFFLFYPYVSKTKSHNIWGPYGVPEKIGERVTGGVGKITYPPPWIGLMEFNEFLQDFELRYDAKYTDPSKVSKVSRSTM